MVKARFCNDSLTLRGGMQGPASPKLPFNETSHRVENSNLIRGLVIFLK